jgi:hypothetical protein
MLFLYIDLLYATWFVCPVFFLKKPFLKDFYFGLERFENIG